MDEFDSVDIIASVIFKTINMNHPQLNLKYDTFVSICKARDSFTYAGMIQEFVDIFWFEFGRNNDEILRIKHKRLDKKTQQLIERGLQKKSPEIKVEFQKIDT